MENLEKRDFSLYEDPNIKKTLESMRELKEKLSAGTPEAKKLSLKLLEKTGMYDSQGNLLPQFDPKKNGQDGGYQPREFEYVGINYGHNNG